MKISKITKMLPILLLLSAIPVFAETANPVTLQDYTLTLGEHIQLREKTGSNVKTATTSFIGDYEGLELNAAMLAEFQVITNQPRKIKLTAVCPNGTQAIVKPSVAAQTNAVSDASGFSLVFSKTGSPVKTYAGRINTPQVTGPQMRNSRVAVAMVDTSRIHDENSSQQQICRRIFFSTFSYSCKRSGQVLFV